MPRRDLVTYPQKVGYRMHPGMLMWLFHRVSGVLVGLFLIFHMLGISGICSFMAEFVKSRCVVSTIGVLFVLHAANGIRIMMMEFFSAADRKKFLPYLAITAIFVIAVGGLLAFKLFTRAA